MLPVTTPYLIGETAFHHQGDVDFLKALIDKAHDLKLDAIKFHLLLDVDDYMIADHEVIDKLRSWCFTKEQWDDMTDYASRKSPDLIFLCNDVASIEWALSSTHDIKAIEIHATGINDIFLLEKAAQFKNTVILGCGGSSVDEIQYVVSYLRNRGKEDLFLMHGFQNYPTDPSDIRLSRMPLLQNLFQLPVGYADHSDPNDENHSCISVLGAAMGFNVLEKHFTHVFGEDRVDSQAAVSAEQILKIKDLLKIAIAAYGENPLELSEAEQKYGNTGPMKKAIVAREDISDNVTLSLDKIAFKRTNASSSISQNQLVGLIGLVTNREIKKDEIIDFTNVTYASKKNSFSQFNK